MHHKEFPYVPCCLFTVLMLSWKQINHPLFFISLTADLWWEVGDLQSHVQAITAPNEQWVESACSRDHWSWRTRPSYDHKSSNLRPVSSQLVISTPMFWTQASSFSSKLLVNPGINLRRIDFSQWRRKKQTFDVFKYYTPRGLICRPIQCFKTAPLNITNVRELEQVLVTVVRKLSSLDFFTYTLLANWPKADRCAYSVSIWSCSPCRSFILLSLLLPHAASGCTPIWRAAEVMPIGTLLRRRGSKWNFSGGPSCCLAGL